MLYRDFWVCSGIFSSHNTATSSLGYNLMLRSLLSKPANYMFGDLQVAQPDARTGTQPRIFPRVGRCAASRWLLSSFPCTASCVLSPAHACRGRNQHYVSTFPGAGKGPLAGRPSEPPLGYRRLVYDRPIRGSRNHLALGTGSLKPGFLGDLDLPERLLRRIPERGAGLQVGNIRNIPAVLFAKKDVDVIVPQLVPSTRSNDTTSPYRCQPICPPSAGQAARVCSLQSRLPSSPSAITRLWRVRPFARAAP
jgi:hypothetical protein